MKLRNTHSERRLNFEAKNTQLHTGNALARIILVISNYGKFRNIDGQPVWPHTKSSETVCHNNYRGISSMFRSAFVACRARFNCMCVAYLYTYTHSLECRRNRRRDQTTSLHRPPRMENTERMQANARLQYISISWWQRGKRIQLHIACSNLPYVAFNERTRTPRGRIHTQNTNLKWAQTGRDNNEQLDSRSDRRRVDSKSEHLACVITIVYLWWLIAYNNIKHTAAVIKEIWIAYGLYGEYTAGEKHICDRWPRSSTSS